MSNLDERFDRLTSLFLGEPHGEETGETAHEPVKQVPRRESQITPLLAGNLPVMAHPWLTHVAARLREGPAALLRASTDGIQCSLLGTKGPAESSDQDFAAWLLRAAAIVRHWFVVPATVQGAEDVATMEVEEAVIATGGDEAATVAAYQLVRRIVECARKHDRVPPLTPIAIVGCSVESAQEAIATISTAAQAFLRQPVPLAGAYPRLERTDVAQQASFPGGFSLAELFEAIRVAEATVDGSRRTQAPPAAAPRPAVAETPAQQSFASSSATARQPLQVQMRPGSYASIISGLWSIALRYPGDAMIEFATDHAGRLHVIAAVEQAALVRQAAAWAQRNASLIRLGFPGLAPDPLPIVERIVFSDATQAVDWHRCGVRLDLVLRAQDKFVHVSLNDERTLKP
ncbi:MAG: hypothetical protein K8R92_10550 [Planctomycetes bacterium]|nr:hypothetical protein [Planctomycetota bacterium]